mmetsp:Transcript_15276/g.36346  ORF Transcript_15276/g.36346 Transcript_15276/m.36346 type:complete len:107 (+) Transcript_15276:23-343(+)
MDGWTDGRTDGPRREWVECSLFNHLILQEHCRSISPRGISVEKVEWEKGGGGDFSSRLLTPFMLLALFMSLSTMAGGAEEKGGAAGLRREGLTGRDAAGQRGGQGD